MLAENSEIMKKANAAISVMEMSPKDKWLYDSRMKYEHDRASCISEGYRQGIEKGMLQGEIKGIEKGAYQTKLETAKNLLAMNFPIQNIVKATGLSIKEVEAL
ncbi:hypothetical protein HMPREF9733_00603 [Treponema denticola SP33]|uniref:Transposase (putative) YhgA-like domain-containing protein n=1 Tax=Treponema denticola SP33 TaxID=999437 RepID=M2AQ76_TREDN|nr:hypothetical protein HMPREF9733_00603 [Treponema denticola SP33]EPF37269.1 hypothetical protein HMPREF9732_01303 [Treponema denticola SP32]